MLRIGALLLAVSALVSLAAQDAGRFELDELTVAQLQDAMASGRYTSRRLVDSSSSRRT